MEIDHIRGNVKLFPSETSLSLCPIVILSTYTFVLYESILVVVLTTAGEMAQRVKAFTKHE